MIWCRHDSVKITRLHKSLAALIILFFFVLGAVAVSVAHESPLSGDAQSVMARLALYDAPARVHDRLDGSLWQLPAGNLPSSGHNDADRGWVYCQRYPVPMAQALISHNRAPKVSLHMLQSILLL